MIENTWQLQSLKEWKSCLSDYLIYLSELLKKENSEYPFIDEACKLLLKDCYKVYEVAEKSGFGDVKYFMKTFKEETGLSPTEWKKVHLNQAGI